jgi:hypothetical protein
LSLANHRLFVLNAIWAFQNPPGLAYGHHSVRAMVLLGKSLWIGETCRLTSMFADLKTIWAKSDIPSMKNYCLMIKIRPVHA